jgi:hypothetical protein
MGQTQNVDRPMAGLSATGASTTRVATIARQTLTAVHLMVFARTSSATCPCVHAVVIACPTVVRSGGARHTSVNQTLGGQTDLLANMTAIARLKSATK